MNTFTKLLSCSVAYIKECKDAAVKYVLMKEVMNPFLGVDIDFVTFYYIDHPGLPK